MWKSKINYYDKCRIRTGRGIILNRLFSILEKCLGGMLVDFGSRRRYFDKIFTLRQVLEHEQTFRLPRICHRWAAALDFIDRAVLLLCFALTAVPGKLISLSQSLYANTRRRVGACTEFRTRSIVRHGCSPSNLSFQFCQWDVYGGSPIIK